MSASVDAAVGELTWNFVQEGVHPPIRHFLKKHRYPTESRVSTGSRTAGVSTDSSIFAKPKPEIAL